MYSAISGLKSHQAMMDVTANDIANVNTIGYKGARTTFVDQLAQTQIGATAATPQGGGRNPGQIGLGVQIGSIDSTMGTGALQPTGSVYDLAIQGEGWFRITFDPPDVMTSPAGAPATADAYTRAGNFTRNSAGFLTTADGAYVLGKDALTGGNDIYILIPDGATSVQIGNNGEVSYLDAATNTRVVAGYLTIARFANEAGLERASTNYWRVTGASGPEVPAGGGIAGVDGGSIVSGVIEMSNVDLATEFTDLISAQRGFQANSRVITTADSMLEELVNLKR
jgi:flagellar hook protein FlgE